MKAVTCHTGLTPPSDEALRRDVELAKEMGFNGVRSLYHLTKTLDPSRIVIGNDGWASVATDVIGIHDHDPDPASLLRRYHAEAVLPGLFRRERPGGRMLVLDAVRSLEILAGFCCTQLADTYQEANGLHFCRARHRTGSSA